GKPRFDAIDQGGALVVLVLNRPEMKFLFDREVCAILPRCETDKGVGVQGGELRFQPLTLPELRVLGPYQYGLQV
ncbi:hypothetical protein BaRGS_00020784, partial [Batillaria attramentaria]